MKALVYSILFCVVPMAQASVSITVRADSGKTPISPWIYGKNGSNVSDDPARPATDSALALPREAGLRMARENAGNNCTKYNWRKKLTSHPDWYNNVYPHDWDFAAKELQSKLPGVQGMFGFQLLGWVASSTAHNFDDWSYNQSKFWEGTGQNLAGGGTVNTSGSRASIEGDANLYLEPWPADSSAAILSHWFGPGGVGLDSTALRYWNMDNEIEIWEGTHDDVDTLLTGRMLKAEDAVQRWIAVAKAARKLFPGIKLVGPASASEWQWYTWPGESIISYKGASYCWPEYLIKRLSEAQDSTGVRMLDVYDVHLYLSGDTKDQVQNQYRLYWDTTYLDPHANGLRFVNGGWSPDERHQMYFHRIEGWLDKHFGKGHGIKVGASESAIKSVVSNYPSETAVWYASMLGTFADHGGEFFTPWDWNTGMWEVLHLFSRYAKTVRVRSTSSLDSLVSAYSSITPRNDSMTVILVNRDGAASQDVTVQLDGFTPAKKGVTLQLADLNGETFHSRTQNALKTGEVNIADGRFTLSVPKYSVTAVTFASQPQVVGMARPLEKAARLEVYQDRVIGEAGRRLELIDVRGNSLRAGIGEVSLRDLPRGIVYVRGQGKMRAVAIP